MNHHQYKEVVNKAYACGDAKMPFMKTQNVLTEQYGNNLDCPEKYQGLTIMEAYMKGYRNE